MFLLVEKIALVDLPTLFDVLVGQYFVVNGERGSSAAVVVDFAFAMEVVHVPVAAIG